MQPFDLGGEGLGEQFCIDLFGDVGGAVSEQTAYNSHGKSIIDGKHGEGVARKNCWKMFIQLCPFL